MIVPTISLSLEWIVVNQLRAICRQHADRFRIQCQRSQRLCAHHNINIGKSEILVNLENSNVWDQKLFNSLGNTFTVEGAKIERGPMDANEMEHPVCFESILYVVIEQKRY
jgi:hypothetical protein